MSTNATPPVPTQPTPPQRPANARAADAPPLTSHAMQPETSRWGTNRRWLAASTLAVAVAVAGIGIPAVVAASESDTTAPASDVASETGRAIAVQESDVDLGDLTLDELSSELDELGLELRVTPAAQMQSRLDEGDSASDDGDFYGDEDWGDEDWGDDVDNYDDTDNDTHDGEPHDHDFDDEETLGAFPVDGDDIDLSTADTPQIAEQSREIWERFVKLIPADQREMVNSFELVPEEFSGAYVYPDASDPTKWVLGVGLGLGDDLDFVLIHEFAHLLSLQASEVPPSDDDGTCETYHPGEGCAIDGALIADFVERFWSEAQQAQINELTENEDWDGLDDFYSDNSEDFVTHYAITNPAEDFADTFATFVTEDEPDNLGSDDLTVAEQKIEWLWSQAEMVELRGQIRANA